jgi:hypothetical protein
VKRERYKKKQTMNLSNATQRTVHDEKKTAMYDTSGKTKQNSKLKLKLRIKLKIKHIMMMYGHCMLLRLQYTTMTITTTSMLIMITTITTMVIDDYNDDDDDGSSIGENNFRYRC